MGIHVSTEEQRSLEEAYRPGSLSRYCGPVPVISLKQILETLTFILCLHLIGNQCSDCKMGLVGGWGMGFMDKSCSCILNLLQSVGKMLGTASK